MFSFCYECSIIFFQVSSLDFNSLSPPVVRSSLSSLVTKSKIKVIISTLENDLLSWINGVIILAMVRNFEIMKSNLVTPVFRTNILFILAMEFKGSQSYPGITKSAIELRSKRPTNFHFYHAAYCVITNYRKVVLR